jgi:hypothetical protein
MINLFAQHNFKVNRPIVPALIHDDNTRLIVCAAIIVVSILALYKIMRYFNAL